MDIELQSLITTTQIIVTLQLFAYETLSLKPINLHLPEFPILRFNHELAENQVHQ